MPGGRPRTPVGTSGVIKVSETGPPFEASVYYRDADGGLRRVRRYAKTKTKARAALTAALAERQRGINSDTTVAELGEEWLRRLDESNKAVGTKQQYRRTFNANVLPALGKLRVDECRVGVVDHALQTIKKQHGYSVAKHARAVMSGMFGLAVRQGALPANPVRDVEELSRTRTPKKPRALTPDEADHIADTMRTLERAISLDIPDLAEFMLMTGCRIGEALAARDGHNPDGEPLIDLEAGTWEINATVVRVRGQGLVIQEQPKSKTGWRRIALPQSAVELARRRLADNRIRPREVAFLDPAGVTRTGHPHIVFPSPFARTLRDTTNCEGDLREILDAIDCDVCQRTGYQLDEEGRFIRRTNSHRVRCAAGPWAWVTSHTFRKTVVTRLLAAGVDSQKVSEHVGHSKVSMTLDVYAGREVISSAAAGVLDR